MANVNTNISLPPELWKRAKQAALDRRISLSQVVRDALAADLGRGKKTKNPPTVEN